jgi:hypothetical protein
MSMICAQKEAFLRGLYTGWKPMLHDAVASQLQVHGESARDGSERPLDNPGNSSRPDFVRSSLGNVDPHKGLQTSDNAGENRWVS